MLNLTAALEQLINPTPLVRFTVDESYAGNPTGPVYATPGAAGCDLIVTQDIAIPPAHYALVGTGLYVELPFGYEMQIRSRSGLAYKNGIVVLNSPGTIDADYRGEVKVLLHNVSTNVHTVLRGDAVAQAVIARAPQALFEIVPKLGPTQRGEGGFGSTGLRR